MKPSFFLLSIFTLLLLFNSNVFGQFTLEIYKRKCLGTATYRFNEVIDNQIFTFLEAIHTDVKTKEKSYQYSLLTFSPGFSTGSKGYRKNVDIDNAIHEKHEKDDFLFLSISGGDNEENGEHILKLNKSTGEIIYVGDYIDYKLSYVGECFPPRKEEE